MFYCGATGETAGCKTILIHLWSLCELSFDLKLITFKFSEVLSMLVHYILNVSMVQKCLL